jgi:hypothetical protein
MKGKVFMDGIVLLIAVVFLILAAYLFVSRNDGASKELKETTSDLKASLKIVQDTLDKVNESNSELVQELKAIKTVSDGLFADHGKRISDIENKKPLTQLNDINLRFKEPLKVSIIYREAMKKLPEIPAHMNGKMPLIKRAGLIP